MHWFHSRICTLGSLKHACVRKIYFTPCSSLFVSIQKTHLLDSRCTKFLNDRVWSLLYLVVYCTLVVHKENTLRTPTTYSENQKSVRYEDDIKAKCFKHCLFTFLQEIVVHIFVNIVIGVPGLFSLYVHYSHHTMHP